MTMVVLLFFILISLLTLIQASLSLTNESSKANTSSLESGFETLLLANFFELQYFLLAVMFVLFDVELILLIPFILSFMSLWPWLTLSLLTLTLLLEWQWTSLKWNT